MGLMLLNQIRFQRQGFGFGIRNDEFDIDNLHHHNGGARHMAVGVTKVRSHAIAQFLGFANVENLVPRVFHKVDARF